MASRKRKRPKLFSETRFFSCPFQVFCARPGKKASDGDAAATGFNTLTRVAMRGRRSRGERIHAPSITAVISSVCLVLLVSSRCSCCRLDRPTRVRVSPPGSRWAQGRPNAFGAPLRLRTTLRLRGGNAQAELQVQQTIQALQILHDPRETQARRGAAHALCEQIKNGDALCVLMARRLSATEHSDAIRHFGFQLFEHVVSHRWAQLPPGTREALKRDVLAIVATGTRPLAVEQRFVLTKLAQVSRRPPP